MTRTTEILRQTLMISLVMLFSFSLEAAGNKNQQNWERRNHHYKSKDSFSDFEIKYQGKIVVTNDDKDVKSISPGGFLIISKSSFGNTRTITVESDDNGKLTRKYSEGKNELQFDPDGKEWLSDVLIEVIRKTGIGAKERVNHIYKEKGISGLLDEIENFETSYSYYKNTTAIGIIHIELEYSGDNVKNLYIKSIIDNIALNKEDLARVLKEIPEVRSNSTKGTLLRQVLSKYELDSYLMEKFLEATSSLAYNTERGNTLRMFQSKYPINRDNYRVYFDIINEMDVHSEKGNVLKPLLSTQKLEDVVMVELLESVERFEINSEKAAILRAALPYITSNDDVIEAFTDAARSLNSHYYRLKDELMEMLLKRGSTSSSKKVDKTSLLTMLSIAQESESNTRKGTILRKMHGSLTNDYEVIDEYFDIINSMSNEFEQYNLLLDLVDKHELDKTGYIRLFDVAENLARDDYIHATTALLRKTLNTMPDDETVLAAFFDTFRKIDHNSGKEEIIRMMCTKGNLSNNTIVQLLKAAEDIDVDIETATSLQEIKRIMPKNDKELDYIFNSIANDIKSDYEYERVFN